MKKQHYERLIEPYIKDLMGTFPAIAIDGLKGVGKTVSTKRLASSVFELDKARDFDLINNVPDTLMKEKPPVLIDEWQRIPSVWDYIRRAVDDNAPPGTFLLTRSITNSDVDIHSGAGRIIRRKMYPLSLEERGLERPTVSIREMLEGDGTSLCDIEGRAEAEPVDYIREIALSGLPEFRRYPAKDRKIAFESYFENMLSHEFQQQGVRLRQPETLLRWLRAYAAAISSEANYTEILDASTAGQPNKPAAKTTIAYREALENLWLLDELSPWLDGESYFTSLKLSPKHYLADPAIAAYLLGLDENILTGSKGWPGGAEVFDKKYGSILGRLFEALVQLSLRTYTTVSNSKLYCFRTHKGAREIDFIIQKDTKVIACEVKFSPVVTASDGKHLRWFKGSVGSDCVDAMIVTTGGVAYRREDGIAVIPAVLLGA